MAILLGVWFVVLGFVAAVFRRPYIRLLASILDARGKPVSARYMTALEWGTFLVGVAFVVAGIVAIAVGVSA